MTQVVIIHGGTTFSTYEGYIEYLRTKPMRLDRQLPKDMWFTHLQRDLGETYQVLMPLMPNKTNAVYREWSIWFSRLAEVLEDDVILIGHSLGGIFLPKYLSEHDFSRKIRATILIAAPYEDESDEDLTDFKITGSLAKFQEQGGEVIFFHGSNDIVPLAELDRYRAALRGVETHVLPAPDHFMRPSFPELVERIQAL